MLLFIVLGIWANPSFAAAEPLWQKPLGTARVPYGHFLARPRGSRLRKPPANGL